MKWADRKLYSIGMWWMIIWALIFLITVPAMSRNTHCSNYKLGDTLTTVVVQAEGGDVRMVSYRLYCVQVNDTLVTFSKK